MQLSKKLLIKRRKSASKSFWASQRAKWKLAYNYTPWLNAGVKNTTLFLHGVYGLKEEWNQITSDHRIQFITNCYSLDAVNHGDSFHHPVMSFEEQAKDVIEFANQHSIDKFFIVGHGMGGRTAIKTAMLYPSRVRAVISLDAPACDLMLFGRYIKRTVNWIHYLSTFDPRGKSLSTIKSLLSEKFKYDEEAVERAVKHFKIDRLNPDIIEWRSNAYFINKNIENITRFDNNGKFTGPWRLLVNGVSNRFKVEHYTDCLPNVKPTDVVAVKFTGHWIHQENPNETIRHIADVINSVSKN